MCFLCFFLGGGGQGRCEGRIEVFVKVQKKVFFLGGGGSGRRGGSAGEEGGSQGRCEREVKFL